MQVTVLGCGASAGVPLIGCRCEVCRSEDARNHRLRQSILIEKDGFRLLVDTSPDIRAQCLRHGIDKVDAILFTHAHADHCHGIDDLRPLNYNQNAAIPAYADPAAMEEIRQRFGYAFKEPIPEFGWFRPALIPHLVDIDSWEPIKLAEDFIVQPFPQWHGKMLTLGLRMGRFAYSTDVNRLPEESFAYLQGLDVWLVDCLRYEPSPTHAHLEMALEWIERVKPKRAVLIHMSHDFDYETFRRSLPDHVEPAYDGLTIDLSLRQ